MSSGYVAVILWRYARNVKQDLDAPVAAAVGARGVIEVSAAGAEQLRGLSAEPILIKQSEEGVRVQIEHRPMLPLMAFVGREVSVALAEAAAEITVRYGATWVVLLDASEDGRVNIQRLA
jgi:hypothetical protein